MSSFTAAEVCQATNARELTPAADVFFTGVSTDTRTVKPGDLFIALTGERFDGHDFIEQAVQNGAAGVIVSRSDRQIPLHCAAFFVADTRTALQGLARYHRQRFNIPIIAITGSNGKTSTKDMIAAVLSSNLAVLKTEANYNNEIGLPLTLLKLTPEHQAAVVEMGMRGPGQIRELASIALPNIGVITNVGETHIELLGSIDNIAAAKGELVESIGADGLVVLNADDHYVREMSRHANSRMVFYGINSLDVDYSASNIIADSEGIEFCCHKSQQAQQLWVPLPGRHNVYNALAAAAVGAELGLSFAQIAQGLHDLVPSAMRLAISRKGDFTIINDAYNASPLSMRAAIDTLAEVASGRKIAVLGDMLELGHIAQLAHQAVGGQLAERKIDVVITVGALARHIASAAAAGGLATVTACDDQQQAQAALAQIIQPGDTILIKGSRGMQMEKVLEMFK